MDFPLSKTIRYELIGFVVLFIFLCTFILVYSPTVLLHVGHDVGPVLDGVWRIQNNQVPHRDFPSILGHGYLLQQYAFLRAFHFDFIAFAVSSVFTTAIAFLIFLSFYADPGFRQQTNFFLRIYLCLLLLSLGLGQYHFGISPTLLTYANLYNRYCFLFLLLLFIQGVLLKGKDKIDRSLMFRLVIIGVLLSYLFYVKLTYFIVAIGWFTVLTVVKVIPLRIYWRLLVISFLIFGVTTWLIGADPLAMLHDYRTISAARGSELVRPSFIRYKLFHYYNLGFLLCLTLLMYQLWARKLPFKYLLLIAYVGGCAMLLQFTNWGTSDIVLLTTVPIVFVLLPEQKRLITSKLFLLVCSFFLLKNFWSIYYLTKAKAQPHSELKSPYLSRFYTDFTESGSGEDYATKVMSGTALLNKNKKSGDQVFSFSFDNPFSFLTHTLPPRRVPIVWQYGTTYTYAVYTNPKDLFSEVDLLLLSKRRDAESATEMMKLYGNTIATFYAPIDSNTYWQLYRKVKPLTD